MSGFRALTLASHFIRLQQNCISLLLPNPYNTFKTWIDATNIYTLATIHMAARCLSANSFILADISLIFPAIPARLRRYSG